MNQFKAALGSGRGHVIPDAVLFVNGLPLVVAEFKSPGIKTPIHAAIDQLLRYSNQRRELFPSLYSENEGVERLFHTNQLMIASDFFEARVSTIGAPPEAYLEWADSSPVPLSTVAEETGVIALPEEAMHEATRPSLRRLDRNRVTVRAAFVFPRGFPAPAGTGRQVPAQPTGVGGGDAQARTFEIRD